MLKNNVYTVESPKTRTLIWTPNTGALVIRTPTKRTPISKKQLHIYIYIHTRIHVYSDFPSSWMPCAVQALISLANILLADGVASPTHRFQIDRKNQIQILYCRGSPVFLLEQLYSVI